MTTQILTSRAAARELRKSDERINWCAIEGYYCGNVSLDCTTGEREAFEDASGISIDADELSPATFAALRAFLCV